MRGGNTTLCESIPTVSDPIDAPVVEGIEDYFVTFEPNVPSEVVKSEPLNATVYIIDENGENLVPLYMVDLGHISDLQIHLHS